MRLGHFACTGSSDGGSEEGIGQPAMGRRMRAPVKRINPSVRAGLSG